MDSNKNKSQTVDPFTFFGTIRLFKILFRFFSRKLDSQEAQRVPLLQFLAIQDFSKLLFLVLKHQKCDFLRPSVFFGTMRFCFIKAPSTFTRNETFCEHKGLLRVFGTMRHFPTKKSEFCFENVFFCFQLGKSGFRVLSSMKGTFWVSRNSFLSFP